MNKIFSTLLIGTALTSFVACTDSDYDDKYADPSKTTEVSVPYVFTSVMFKGNTWMNPRYYRYYTQSTTSGTFSGIIGNANGKSRFMGATEGYFNNRWKDFYDMLTQFRLLENTYNNLLEDEQNTYKIFYHASRILIDGQLHEMLSLFGDVPFTGAGMLWNPEFNYNTAKEQCVYDDDVALYKQILTDLKEAGDFFNSGNIIPEGASAFKRQDYSIAKGDLVIWQKYANSLRLRIALHLATKGDCAEEAKKAIKEVLDNPGKYPVIDDNSENMGVKGDTQSDDFNYGKNMAQALHTGSMAAGSQAMLTAMNVPENGIPDDNTDPRLQVIYDCNPDGEYIAYDVNLSNSEISDISDKKHQEYVKRGIEQANYYCIVDSQAIAGWKEYEGNSNLNGLWISAAEVSLSKAEAYLMGYGVATNEAKAKENFIKGVEQSTEYYWNLKKTSTLYKNGNDSYKGYRELVEPTEEEIATYAESVWEPNQKAICTQLWLNFGVMNELEAWNVVRRTGYPEVTFAKDGLVSNYATPPHRLPYPSDELNYNSVNCQNAIKTNYESNDKTGYYTHLFWAKDGEYYKLTNNNK